jgi:hypothetical protein
MLHFGYPINHQKFIDFATSLGMAQAMYDESREFNVDMGVCISGSIGTLMRQLKCRFNIVLACPTAVPVISFYTNYTFDKAPKDDAIERVRTFLEAECPPKWYLDRANVHWL